MATIVFLIILAVPALLGLAFALFAKRPNPVTKTVRDRFGGTRDVEEAPVNLRPFGWLVFAVFGVILVVVTFFQSFKIVGANEVGVPVTFGKVAQAIDSGPHFVTPWTEVETLPTRPETVTTDAQVRSSQSGHAAIRLAGRWSTSEKDAPDLYQQVRTGDDDKIEQDIVIPQLQGAANEFYGGLLNTDMVNGERASKNAAGVMALAKQRLAKYGIQLVDVQIRSATPDKSTEDALSRISAQQRATQIAEESQKTADAQAGQRLIEAEGLKAAAEQLKDFTPGQVQLLCMQAAERVANEAVGAKIPAYVLPCQSAPASVLAK